MSKSVLDLKQAKQKCLNLVSTLKEVTKTMSKLEPMSTAVAAKFKALAALPDCQQLLEESSDTNDTSLKEDLSTAARVFHEQVPGYEGSFQTFVEFMAKQWQPSRDNEGNMVDANFNLTDKTDVLRGILVPVCYAGEGTC